ALTTRSSITYFPRCPGPTCDGSRAWSGTSAQRPIFATAKKASSGHSARSSITLATWEQPAAFRLHSHLEEPHGRRQREVATGAPTVAPTAAPGIRCKSDGRGSSCMVMLGDGGDISVGVAVLAGGDGAWPQLGGWLEQRAAQAPARSPGTLSRTRL